MSTRLQVVISPSLERRVDKAAARARMSKGEWVRRAIECALSDPRTVTAPVENLARLGAPTGDIEQMLAEIESGRG